MRVRCVESGHGKKMHLTRTRKHGDTIITVAESLFCSCAHMAQCNNDTDWAPCAHLRLALGLPVGQDMDPLSVKAAGDGDESNSTFNLSDAKEEVYTKADTKNDVNDGSNAADHGVLPEFFDDHEPSSQLYSEPPLTFSYHADSILTSAETSKREWQRTKFKPAIPATSTMTATVPESTSIQAETTSPKAQLKTKQECAETTILFDKRTDPNQSFSPARKPRTSHTPISSTIFKLPQPASNGKTPRQNRFNQSMSFTRTPTSIGKTNARTVSNASPLPATKTRKLVESLPETPGDASRGKQIHSESASGAVDRVSSSRKELAPLSSGKPPNFKIQRTTVNSFKLNQTAPSPMRKPTSGRVISFQLLQKPLKMEEPPKKVEDPIILEDRMVDEDYSFHGSFGSFAQELESTKSGGLETFFFSQSQATKYSKTGAGGASDASPEIPHKTSKISASSFSLHKPFMGSAAPVSEKDQDHGKTRGVLSGADAFKASVFKTTANSTQSVDKVEECEELEDGIGCSNSGNADDIGWSDLLDDCADSFMKLAIKGIPVV
ncbi:hypothetical protein BJ741DRAFT_597860 [Chytriomyces cf. hyalinus JEL632]|nr:hypothetical protein BJ741DRAFT_597860 [Chytriomyces cf. hyalinus JEL632]